MKKRLVPTFILIAYIVILIIVMVFKNVPAIKSGPVTLDFGGTNGGHPANFVPFKTIFPYLVGEKGLLIGSLNIIGNIALLVPLGFLIPFVYRSINWKKSFAFALASSLIIEGMQVVLCVGIFDIDDVILNALGLLIGYWAFVILAKWFRSKNYKNIIISAIILGIATAVGFYIFYPELNHSESPDVRVGDAHFERKENIQEEGTQTSQGTDLCRGTGGTGQIIDKSDNTITIKRGDGVEESISITDRTDIQTSTGPGSQSDLQIEDRVTVVIDDTETAEAIFVCG